MLDLKKEEKKVEELVANREEMISERKKIQKGPERNQLTNREIEIEETDQNVKNVIVQDSQEIMIEEEKGSTDKEEDRDNTVIEKTEETEETEESEAIEAIEVIKLIKLIKVIEEIEARDNREEKIKDKLRKQSETKLMSTDSIIEQNASY